MKTINSYIVIKIRCESYERRMNGNLTWFEVDVQSADEYPGLYHTFYFNELKSFTCMFKRKSESVLINFSEMERSLSSNFNINLNKFLTNNNEGTK